MIMYSTLKKNGLISITENRGADGAIEVTEEIINEFTSFQKILMTSLAIINWFNIPKEYIKEIKQFSKMCGLSWRDLYIANCIYEATMLSYFNFSKTWCTSATIRTRTGLKHFRNLDWPIESLRAHSRIIEFRNRKTKFISICNPGQFGVTTGYSLTGKFSISMNMDLLYGNFDKKGMPVQFLIRKCLEICKSYNEAREFIIGSKTLVPALVHIVSKENNIIIQKTCDDNQYYTESSEPMCITNHIPEDYDLIYDPDEHEELDSSTERLNFIKRKIKKAKTIKDGKKIITSYPIYNDQTKQSVLFNLSSGKITMCK